MAFVAPHVNFLERHGFDATAVAENQKRVNRGAAARQFLRRSLLDGGLAVVSARGPGGGFLVIGRGGHEILYSETPCAVWRSTSRRPGISGSIGYLFPLVNYWFDHNR